MSRQVGGAITTIHYPTRAVKMFAAKKNITFVVVADKKTPIDWILQGVNYTTVKEQTEICCSLSDKIPWNHYARKMLGYLFLIKQGYDVIYDTDDDNVPKANWIVPEFSGTYLVTGENHSFVNIYQYFTPDRIWPRGLPLRLLKDNFYHIFAGAEYRQVNIGIWQGLADGDPDVDAIYRLVLGDACNFLSKPPIVLGKGTICPFNSQNTFFSKLAFPLLYLPCTVSSRYCDILRGLIAQPILWAQGLQLGFMEATVVQERNPHNYFEDFKAEISMYETVDLVVSAIDGKVSGRYTLTENLVAAYEELIKLDIVTKHEEQILHAWLYCLEKPLAQ